MGFEQRDKKVIDTKDFSKLFNKLPSAEFAIAMHERLVKETKIVETERHEFDLADINRILANYPSHFSWAYVEAELINEMYEKAKEKFEDWKKEKYNEVSNSMTGKPTIAAIEAEVAKRYKEELVGKREEILELQTKSNVAKNMTRVWGNAINSLQSLSKNINAEMDLIRTGKGGI